MAEKLTDIPDQDLKAMMKAIARANGRPLSDERVDIDLPVHRNYLAAVERLEPMSFASKTSRHSIFHTSRRRLEARRMNHDGTTARSGMVSDDRLEARISCRVGRDDTPVRPVCRARGCTRAADAGGELHYLDACTGRCTDQNETAVAGRAYTGGSHTHRPRRAQGSCVHYPDT